MAYAALIAPLVFSGSRKSDGSANATGVVYFYRPGTLTPVNVYADANAETYVTAPLTLDNGGRVPFDTYPDGLFATQPVRVLIQGTDGLTVSDVTFIPATAGNVGVNNDYFPDATTLDEVLTEAGTSFGGEAFQYQESGGATARPAQDKFREQGISVKDFGAVGDGIADDTSAIQEAMDRATTLSTNVTFPAGSYAISQALNLLNATGVRLIGAGQGTVTITQSNGATGVFVLTSCTDASVESMSLAHSGTSSNAGVAFILCVRPTVLDVAMDDNFAYGAGFTGTGQTNARIDGSYLTGSTYGVQLTNVIKCSITNTQINNLVGSALFIEGTTSTVYVGNCSFAATNGIVFNTGLTGTMFTVEGCPLLGSNTVVPIDMSALTADPLLRQWGNRVDGAVYSAAIGNTLTILRAAGEDNTLVAASGGAGTQTVAEPLPRPTGSMRNLFLTTRFKNASGGAVTWSLNAIFVAASAIPTTDGHTINVRWLWDGTATKWREVSRSDTVT